MNRDDLADSGDLAAVIDEAVSLERENPEKYDDYSSRPNQPNTSYSSGSLHPLGETKNPPQFRIHAKFVQAQSTTTYSIEYTNKIGVNPTAYAWVLRPPADNDKCDNRGHGGPTSSAATFAWYHGNDACSHAAEDPKRGHKGNVDVTLSFPGLACRATYYGSQGDGTPEGDGTDSACTKP